MASVSSADSFVRDVPKEDAVIIINEVLNFVKNSFVHSTCGQLKPVLMSFYSEEELTNAKNTIHKALTDAGVDDLPRLISRKGDSKIKMTVDDLLDLFVIVDERKLLNHLPRFVADNLSRIPTVCPDNMNIAAIARKLEMLENRQAAFSSMEARLAQVEYAVTALPHITSSHPNSYNVVPDNVADHRLDPNPNCCSRNEGDVVAAMQSQQDTTRQTLQAAALAEPLTAEVPWSAVTRRHRPPQVHTTAKSRTQHSQGQVKNIKTKLMELVLTATLLNQASR